MLALSLLVAGAPAAATADPLPQVVQASAASSAWGSLELPEGLGVGLGGYDGQRPSGGSAPSFELRADHATFVAAQLRAVKPSLKGYHPSLFGLRWKDKQTDTIATDNVLPDGTYQLFLMTDGRNPTAELRIPEGVGSRVMALSHAMEARSVTADAGGNGLTRFAGTSLALSRPGLLRLDVELSSSAGPTRIELCGGSRSETNPEMFGPGCPGLTSKGSSSAPEGVPEGQCCIRQVLFDAPANAYAIGGNVTAGADPQAAARLLAFEYPPADGKGESLSPPGPGPGADRDQAIVQPTPWIALDPKATVTPGGRLRVKLGCQDLKPCRGRATAGGAPRNVVVEAGKSRAVTLALSRRVRRSLARARRSTATIRVQGTDGNGAARVAQATFRVRLPGSPRRRAR